MSGNNLLLLRLLSLLPSLLLVVLLVMTSFDTTRALVSFVHVQVPRKGTTIISSASPSAASRMFRITSSLPLSPSSSSSSSYNSIFPESRTDLRNFLTQRSIQSFVFLLNQCREDHTVHWLEKKLDFARIDMYHGTGAFNQTKFPDWDSIFLEYVDHPEEIMVVQIRQQRRQRKLSGFNEYFDSLSKNKKPSSSSSLSSSSSSLSPFKKKKKKEKTTTPSTITSRKLSDTSNYLDTISASSTTKMPNKKSTVNKTTNNKSRQVSSNDQHVRGSSSSSSSSSNNGASSSASSSVNDGNYLDSNEERRPTTKQSTELSRNPYLHETPQEYELSIDPPALVRRILSVREQLSKEWIEDLEMLIQLNDEILDTFEDYTNEANSKDIDDDDDDDDDNDDDVKISSDVIHSKNATIVTNQDEDGDGNASLYSSDLDLLEKALDAPDAEKESISNPSSPTATSSSSTGSIASFDTSNTAEEDKKSRPYNNNTVFDRNVLLSWTQSLWSPKLNSSPYRKSTFDLLLLLSTQESIHRVLNFYRDNKDVVRPETFEWLLEFYKEHVADYFDGHQTYARSEDFLEKMLTSPRTLIETKSRRNSEVDFDDGWIDPARVAEDIVRERSEVSLDWMKISETILDEHTDLRRLLFTNTLSKSPSSVDESLSETIRTAVNITEVKNKAAADAEGSSSTSSISPTEAYGAFE